MKEIIKALILFEQKYDVAPSIHFEHECGGEYVYISFEKGKKRIDKRFYFVPIGDDSDKSFELYNSEFDVEIEKAIEELLNIWKGSKNE